MKNILKDSQSKNLCLWIVPGQDGKVRKFRLTYFRIFLFAAVFTLLGGALVFVAGDYTRVQMLRFKHYLLLKQVEQQRDNLAQSNDRLEAEVTEIKELNSKVMAYELDVRQKLSELSDVLESATSLGVVEETEGSADAPPMEGGMGGPEFECGSKGSPGVNCPQMLADAGIRARLSMTGAGYNELAFAGMNRGGSLPDAKQEGLPDLLDRYLGFVKALPLGNPAHGKITSGYGYRNSPFTKKVSLHQGVDISLSQGTAIKCTGAGIVRAAERSPNYGLMVDIEHSDKVITRYAHLSKILVSVNQKVAQGDVIGLAGSTGRSTGPHLHYEVRVDGKAKNPKNFMNLAKSLKEIL